MDNLASLSLAIDSSAAVSATASLDRLTASSERTGRATDAIREASSQLVAALNRNTTATEALTTKLTAMEAAGARAGTALTSTGAAADAATSNVIKFDRASVSAKSSIDSVAASARNATAAWAALGAMGASTAEKLEIARRMASASAVIAAPPVSQVDQAAAWAAMSGQGSATIQGLDVARRMSGGMLGTKQPVTAASQAGRAPRPDELRNLAMQGGDIFTSLFSGASPGMVAAQQGPQIAQIFGPGGASVGGVFKAVGESAASLAARIGLVGGAFAGLTTVAVAGVAAQMSYASTQKEVQKSLVGIGSASGATAGQINAIAASSASAGNVSTREARSMASTFASTGKIGTEMYAGLIGSAKDYAATTGQDLTDATSALAGAFADPSQGADALNKQLGFLNATTQESIQRMQAQGDRLGAQRVLFDAYKTGLTSASELTTGWGRITAAAGNAVADAWDRVGRNIDLVVTGGSLEDQIESARKVLAESQALQQSGIGRVAAAAFGQDPARDQAKLNDLLAKQAKQVQDAETKQQNQRSLQVGATIRSLTPEQEQIKGLEDKVVLLRRAVSDPVKFGFDPQSFSVAEGALGRLSRLWQTMADDVARYGSAQTAALVRTAEFNNRLVGATPYGRSGADVDQKLQNDLREKGLDPVETRRAADAAREDYNRRLSDPNIDPAEGRALSAAREASQRSLRELEGLQRARDLEIDTQRKTQTIDQTQRGGAFARAPADIQSQILAATQRFPTVPPEILAAIGEKENGFRLTGPTKVLNRFGQPSTSAYGFGQITDDAETDIRKLPGMGGFDKTNPSTAVEGAAAYFSQRLKWVNGDMIKALDGYGTGPGYGLDVMRKAGQLGDVSTLGVSKEQDANSRAVDQANDNLKNVTANYGRNAVALEANGRAQDQYRQLIERGVPAAEAAGVAFGGLQTKIAAATQSARFVQFDRDDSFARDQVGRTRADQQAETAARPYAGSAYADVVRDRARDTASMTDAKNTFSDVFGSVVSDLRKGADAATVASDALGKFADKLLSNALDKVASGFGSALTGSASSGGILKLLGFDEGGYTGPGGRLQPAGIVHAGEVVWSQSDVARYGGPAVVDSMRRGLRGYADGGLAGWQPPAANVNQAPANIQIINNTPVRVDAQEVPDGRGGRQQQIVINEAVADGIRSPQGQSALGQRKVAQR